jgi:predicted RNase H-like HicB family nuclease
MKLKVILHPEKEGGYSVAVPAIPGCCSQGETVEEAMANIREALEGYIDVANEHVNPFHDLEAAGPPIVREIEL